MLEAVQPLCNETKGKFRNGKANPLFSIEYYNRDCLLERLGFHSYGEYLQSELWRDIRIGKLKGQKRCELCKDKAREVHHLSYCLKCLNGEAPWHLVCLCSSCHSKIEFTNEGRKNTFSEVNKVLRSLLKKKGQRMNHTAPKRKKRKLRGTVSGKLRKTKRRKRRRVIPRENTIEHLVAELMEKRPDLSRDEIKILAKAKLPFPEKGKKHTRRDRAL